VITLQSIEPLFSEESPIPKDTLKAEIIEDFKLKELTGIPDQNLEISFNPDEGSDIIIKLIDPHAASGYLVFQDEAAYNDWVSRQLYEPSQGEIEEAANRGTGS